MRRSTSWYDRFAGINDFCTFKARFYRAARREAIDRLELQRGDVVLDLFCGTGVNFPMLVDRVGMEGRVVGVDGAAGMLGRAEAKLNGQASVVDLLQADFTTSGGIESVRKAISAYGTTKFVFGLGLTCLPNWRDFTAAVFEHAPTGSDFSIVDVYSERKTLGPRLMNWIGATDCGRPVWRGLEELADNFGMTEYRPYKVLGVPVLNISVMVAWGRKAA